MGFILLDYFLSDIQKDKKFNFKPLCLHIGFIEHFYWKVERKSHFSFSILDKTWKLKLVRIYGFEENDIAKLKENCTISLDIIFLSSDYHHFEK